MSDQFHEGEIALQHILRIILYLRPVIQVNMPVHIYIIYSVSFLPCILLQYVLLTMRFVFYV